MNKQALINQLLSMRAQIDAALFLLTENDQCEHKNRINLTAMGGPEEWQCQDCGYHYKEGEE